MTMTVSPNPTQAAAIGRFKRLSDVTSSKGMKVSVDGAEIRAILAVLDELIARAETAEAALAAKPTKQSKPEPSDTPAAVVVDVPDEMRGILLAVDEILQHRAELWAQPLRTALTAWCASTGDPISAEWLALLDASRS